MFTVAMIGPDGVGKTTVSRQLAGTLPMPAKYLYMGVNIEASNVALPTSRLLDRLRRALGKQPHHGGPRDPSRRRDEPRGAVRRAARALKRGLRLANQLADEWYRQAFVRWYLWRGYVVLLDRDFFADFYSYDIAENGTQRSLSQRIHGFMLSRFYRRPDLVICLDADASTMYARKGEGTVELLDRRRNDYLQLRGAVKRFAVVDADRPLGEVVGEIAERICDFQASQAGGVAKPLSRAL